MAVGGSKTVIFRMNGVGNAFLREVGCLSCPQCSVNKPRANTSGSLIIKSKRKIEKHILFDFGLGVADSLKEIGIDKVDALFNSHNHFDHIAGLDGILNSLKRTQQDEFDPIILYSTQETWRKGIRWSYPWLEGMLDWRSIDTNVITRTPIKLDLDLDLDVDLKVTPVPVYHGPYAFDPVIFVIEFGRGECYKKLVLCWDFLHLVTRHPTPSGISTAKPDSYVPESIPTTPGSYGYPTDDYPEDKNKLYSGLDNTAEKLGLGDLLPEHMILKNADELFLSGNTISSQAGTGHSSITAGMELVRRIKPIRTWIVHYSGHEDPFGPLSDDQLQDWIDRNKGDSEQEILVAQHGMMLSYEVR